MYDDFRLASQKYPSLMYRTLVLDCVIFLVISSQVYAQNTSDTTTSNDFFSKSRTEQRNAPHSKKVEALAEQGLNIEDAEYYASVDDLVAKLENSGKTLDLDKVEAITPKEVAANPRGFKQRVLAGDPAAIKAGLESPVMKQGFEDIEKLMELYPKQERYVVQYPDGTFIEFGQNKGIKVSGDQLVKPSGYAEKEWWSDSNCSGGGPGVCVGVGAYWQFGNGTYWAKTSIINFDYKTDLIVKPNGDNIWSSTAGSYTPGAASSGFVSYGTPSMNTSRTNAQYNATTGAFVTANTYAEAQIYYTVTVSGSVGGSVNFSFLSLSLSVNAGYSYTQYCMYRLYPYNNGSVATVAAYFK